MKKVNFNIKWLIFLLVAFAFVPFFVKSIPTAFAEEMATESKAKQYSKVKVCKTEDQIEQEIDKEELKKDFSDDSLIVVMTKEASEINKPFDMSLVDDQRIVATDLTHINGKVEDKKYLNLDEFRQIFKLTLPIKSKENVLRLVLELKSKDVVELAEPNYFTNVESPISTNVIGDTLNSMSDDDTYQWGLDAINIQDAWKYTKGSPSIKVGIIDSGVAPHRDLVDNLEQGYDYYNNNTITTDDADGHGTAVAGVVAGKLYGVAPNVKLCPMQVTYQVISQGKYKTIFDNSALAAAINDAIDKGIDIINYSIGGYNSINSSIEKAIQNYTGLFVCSAGNKDKNVDDELHYPSDLSRYNYRVISVGNIDKYGFKAEKSNYGKSSVSLYAPGTDIITTSNISLSEYLPNSGTSFSTPHVVGVAALLLSYDPCLTAEDLKSIILKSADEIHLFRNGTDYGWVKKLNAGAAFELLTNRFETKDINDNEIEIVGRNYESMVMGIPNEYNGKKVTSLGGSWDGVNLLKLVLHENLTNICDNVFNNCISLREVEFSETPITIGEYAFAHTGLQSISLFAETIKNYAFEGCKYLEKANFNKNINSIGKGIFANCSSLEEITGEKNLYYNFAGNCILKKYLLGIEVYNELVMGCNNCKIPNNIRYIYESALRGMELANNLSFPNINKVENYAFYESKSLQKITLGYYLTSIGSYAFANIDSLIDFTINQGLGLNVSYREIGNFAFENCKSLTNLDFGGFMKFIGERAFEGCTSINSVSNTGNTYLYKDNCLSTSSTLIALFRGNIIPTYIETIGAYAIINREELESITIEDNIQTIKPYAFYGCTNLKSAVFEIRTWDLSGPDYGIGIILDEPSVNAHRLSGYYCNFEWYSRA